LLVPFSLNATQSGLISSSGLYGMAVGCLIAGPLADRYGRKTIFQYFLIWFAVWTGICALVGNFESMVAVRFVLGIGLGGELPVGITLITEMLPTSGRRLVPLYQSFYAFGWLAAAGVSFLLIPAFPFGWRLVFIVGFVPVLYAAYLRRKLPESPRWLAQHARLVEAQRVVDSLRDSKGSSNRETSEHRTKSGLEFKPRYATGYSSLDLFRGALAKRTLVSTVYWFAAFLAGGAGGLLYVLLVQVGFPLQTTLLFGIIAALAGGPGFWVGAYFLGRIGRKPTLLFYALAFAVAYFAVVRTLDPAVIVACLMLTNFCSGGVGSMYTYLAEQYPTEIRATATAWVNMVGRIALASGALIVGVMMDVLGPQTAFTVAAGVFVLAGLIVMVFGIETRGKTLEEIQALT
jgi:putative MFS transporter